MQRRFIRLRPLMIRLVLLLLLVSSPVLAGFARADTTVRWEATSGLLPDQSTPAWVLFDDAVPEDPVLGATFLTLSTDVESENVYYLQSGADVSISDPLILETRLRVLSSSASAPARAAMLIAATLSPSFGNSLHVGVDEIFVLLDNNVKGPSAVVDTNDQFHTYRIEANLAGSFDVYYDDVLTLSGSSFTNASANGNVPRILWGLASSFSTGTVEIAYIEHGAGVPAVPALGGLGGLLLLGALAAYGVSRASAS